MDTTEALATTDTAQQITRRKTRESLVVRTRNLKDLVAFMTSRGYSEERLRGHGAWELTKDGSRVVVDPQGHSSPAFAGLDMKGARYDEVYSDITGAFPSGVMTRFEATRIFSRATQTGSGYEGL